MVNLGLVIAGVQVLAVVVTLWVLIISPEIKSMKKVVAVIDYIDEHKDEFIRIDNMLWRIDPHTGLTDINGKMLSTEGDGRVFVAYGKNNYGSTTLKGILQRASLLINSFPNEKSHNRKSV